MIAGMPGTGLGGIFYLLLAVVMPLRELARLIRGRSTVRRRRVAIFQAALAVSVVAVLAIEGWALKEGLKWLASRGDGGESSDVAAVSQTVVPAVAAAPLIVLGLMYAGLHVVRWFRRAKR